MPLTPLHYPIAYVMYKVDKRLSLPGLTVGSMFTDLEIPVIFLFFRTWFPDRFVFHSLVGAATIGTVFATMFTVLLYPRFVSVFPGMEKEKVRRKCNLSIDLVFSCLSGTVSHVLLDFVNHSYNPIFWPFQSSTFSPICFALGDIINLPLIIILVFLLTSRRENVWEKLLIGD